MDILGVRIDGIGMEESTALLKSRISEGKQTAVYTPNPIIIRRAMKDAPCREALNRAEVTVADGVGVVIGARIIGGTPPKRVAGITLGEEMLIYAADAGLRVFLLGGKHGVAEKAAKRLCKRFPSLLVCGTHHGYWNDSESHEVLRIVKESRADVVMVCLGSPRQELWIDENRASLPDTKLFMALGGALDVWSGHTHRAPRAFRKMGLEWAWRMAHQPRRLPGLIPISAFLLSCLRTRIKKRKQE